MIKRALDPDVSGLLVRGRVDTKSAWFFATRASNEDWRAAGCSLMQNGFAVVDNFLGTALALTIREQGVRMARAGSRSFRCETEQGERTMPLDPDDERMPMLQYLLKHCDGLVQQMAAAGVSDLRDAAHTNPPVLSVCSPDGSRRVGVTSWDSASAPSGSGAATADARRRVLTVRYHLNPCWRPVEHGGCLQLWRADGSSSVATLAPALDRVILFWSDADGGAPPCGEGTLPDAVLPTHRERLSIAVRYRQRAAGEPRGGCATAAADAAATAAGRAQHSGALGAGPTQAEAAYLAALRTASNSLVSKAHVQIRTNDATLGAALEGVKQGLRARAAASVGNGLFWVDNAAVTAKCKILLHQLMPMHDLAAGCTQLMLARSAGPPGQWLPKLRGAKAVVITQLGELGDTGRSCGVSAHSRRQQYQGRPSGFPRAGHEPVILDAAPGTLHVFDCSLHPLNFRLADAEVAAMWSFGGDAAPEEVARAQAEAYIMAIVE